MNTKSFLCGIAKRSGQKSYLSFILPDALVCYLSTHSAKEFAKILVGDYDTPEAIWSPEMRQYMVSQLRDHERLMPLHIELLHNYVTVQYLRHCYIQREKMKMKLLTKVLYCYDPVLQFIILNERGNVLCGYYLRNLCNSTKFPHGKFMIPLAFYVPCWMLGGGKNESAGR